MKRITNVKSSGINRTISEYGGVHDPRHDEYEDDSLSGYSPRSGSHERSYRDIGLFNSFSKKISLEAVDPKMHRWDAADLLKIYKSFLATYDKDLYDQVYNKKQIAAIPDNLITDCFQNHYVNSREVSFNLNEYNLNSYEFSKRINDEYMQVITNNSIINSFITTREIIYTLQKALQEQNQSPKEASGGEDPNSNEGKDNVAQMCNNLMNSKGGKNRIDNAKQKAMEEIQEFENNEGLTDTVKDDEDESNGGNSASKTGGFNDIMKKFEFMNLVKKVSVDSKALTDMVKHSIDSTVSYFTANYREFKESIITAENVNELIGAEYVADELFMTHFEDIETTYRKYKMKLDVYIDISGSMDSMYNFDKKRLCCLDICKLLTIKLKQKGILNKIHVFNTMVIPRKSLKHLLDTSTSGGTSIDVVLQEIIKSGIPSLIITDAQDSISHYTDKAYFLTIGGGSPSCYNAELKGLYNANHQGISYLTNNTFEKIKF